MIICILILIGCFVWSHTHQLMEIQYSIYFEQEFQKGDNITFNFIEGVKFALNSKAYVVASLIIICSGILPYLKLLTLLYLDLTASLNKKLHCYIDWINRFAYIDIFFILLIY